MSTSYPAVRKGRLCGFETSLDEVRRVPTPKATETWLPIPFGDIIDLLKERLGAHGYSLLDEHYALKTPKKEKNAQQLFGVMNVMPDGGDGASHPDWCQAIGLQSSHNKTLPVRLCGGGHVFNCTNLQMYGDVFTMRKHTPNAVDDLPVKFDEMLEKIAGVFERQEKFVTSLKGTELTDVQAHDIMMRIARRDAFPVSKMMKVAHAWDVERGLVDNKAAEFPRVGYTEKGNTAWDLLNSFTFVNRERTAENQIETGSLTSIFEQELLAAA